MGFTLTLTNDSVVRSLPTTEQEAIAATNHDRMKRLEANPPIAIGSDKQINWAKAIASQFLFHAHAWGFTANDIDLLFANTGKHARFWIDNRNPSGNSGEGKTRIAIEKELAHLKRDAAVMSAMSSRTDAEFKTKARRF